MADTEVEEQESEEQETEVVPFDEYREKRRAEEAGSSQKPDEDSEDESESAGEPGAGAGGQEPETEKTGEEPSKTRLSGAQRNKIKIHELESKATAAEEKAAKLEAELEEARKAKPAGEPPPAEAKPAEAPKKPTRPNPSDFETDEALDEAQAKYIEDLTAYSVEVKLAAQRQADRAEAQANVAKAEVEKVITAHQKRVVEFQKTKPDYDAKVEAMERSWTMPVEVLEAVATSPVSERIAYHLATTAGEVERFKALSPIQAAREIGKLEAKLTPPKSTKSPEGYTPPPPPDEPLRGGGPPLPLSEVTDFTEYKRRSQARAR